MKFLTTTLTLFLLLCFTGKAQDTIKFKDGSREIANIEEVTTNHIKYKKTENPTGPSYIVPVSDVSQIIYSNGRRESFASQPESRYVQPAPASQPSPQGSSGRAKYSGPRIGCTYVGEGTAATYITDRGKFPLVTQFGWQFETRIFTSSTGISGVAEFVPLIAGLEQGMFLPSGSVLFGIRGREGMEFALGPNLSLTGLGMVFAAGTSFKVDDIYFPVNIAFVPSVTKSETQVTYSGKKITTTVHSGFRISLLVGFNTRKY